MNPDEVETIAVRRGLMDYIRGRCNVKLVSESFGFGIFFDRDTGTVVMLIGALMLSAR